MLTCEKETYAVIGACIDVHRELGPGFLEPVYQEALEIALQDIELPHEREKQLRIHFRGRMLNKAYVADFICCDHIIVELKAVTELTGAHEAQLLNYLKATRSKVGLLVNFGQTRLHHKRLVF